MSYASREYRDYLLLTIRVLITLGNFNGNDQA